MYYAQILDYIFSLKEKDPSAKKHNLQKMEWACSLFDHPERSFQTVHVTGSNGKGSVGWKIARLLQECRLRVGLYSSPHLFSYCERMRINQATITKKEVEELFQNILPVLEKAECHLWFFELTTLAAFIYFRQQKIDIAVIEVGIGGRLDSTNVITSILSVITSVALEHTALLGNTIEQVAWEKGGIIRPSRPVVLGPNVPRSVLQDIASAQNSPVIFVENTAEEDYEKENQNIARAAFQELQKILSLPEINVEKIIEQSPPCRFEVIETSILQNNLSSSLPQKIVFDVAHNSSAFKRLFQKIKATENGQQIVLVCGMSKDKDIEASLVYAKGIARKVYPISNEYERLASAQEVHEHCSAVGLEADLLPSTKEALLQAFATAKQLQQNVVVCGSFFIMKDVRKLLGLLDLYDE